MISSLSFEVGTVGGSYSTAKYATVNAEGLDIEIFKGEGSVAGEARYDVYTLNVLLGEVLKVRITVAGQKETAHLTKYVTRGQITEKKRINVIKKHVLALIAKHVSLVALASSAYNEGFSRGQKDKVREIQRALGITGD